jgi:DNA topoisomerase-1
MSHSHSAFVRDLAKAKGLTLVAPAALTLRRIPRGAGFSYCHEDGRRVRDKAELARLKALAVPPAYVEVRFAADPSAHLQAVGTDAAGRLQYRYHPAWTDVREAVKARRLATLARALPEIKRAVVRTLAAADLSADFAAAAVVHLVDLTALRAGAERHARDRGTRGASTLLKSNVVVRRNTVLLEFKAKGAKRVTKEVRDARLAKAIARLQQLPGRRLFQYRAADGAVHSVRAREVNDYLREVGGRRISLKDFRTLVGSTGVLEALAAHPAGRSQRERRSQLQSAVVDVAEELANTPTVCRKSYVHAAVVTAFENGRLSRMRKVPRSAAKKAAAVARLVTETVGETKIRQDT